MKKKSIISEVRQFQKTAGLLKEDELDFSDNPLSMPYPKTMSFTFNTKFILQKIEEALDGGMIPVEQIDFKKLQSDLQEDLYIQIDNGFYFEELYNNDGLADYEA